MEETDQGIQSQMPLIKQFSASAPKHVTENCRHPWMGKLRHYHHSFISSISTIASFPTLSHSDQQAATSVSLFDVRVILE
jgi:hypothetical protein